MSKIRVVFAVAGLVLLSTAPALLAQGVVSRDIDYVTGARYEDGKDLLDVFMPEGANGVPVVVFFHGGALRGGDKGSGRAVAERLVPEGIGVVSASYRLSPTFRHPARSSPELCVKVRGSSSMLLLGCLGDLLRFEKREIQVATFAPDRSSP